MSDGPNRIVSLDQFRGYTVLGMFVVNFVGGLQSVHPTLLHHHTYLSYADTIMPQFLFAVGFGMRFSFENRLRRVGAYQTYSHFAWRCLGLILLGVVVYRLTGDYATWEKLRSEWQSQSLQDFLVHTIKRGPFETLTHIGVTSLWVLPVIARPAWVRALFAAGSAGLHVWLSLSQGYYEWNLADKRGIDGGPLGFLTWTVPLVAGTLVHDWVVTGERPVLRSVLFGVSLTALGTLLAVFKNADATFPLIQPAGEPQLNYWIMSQRAGSVTYLLCGAGIAALLYAFFRVASDHYGLRLGLFALLGRHALAGYLIHGMVSDTMKPFCPKDSPLWWVSVCLSVYLAISIVFIRYLDRNRLWLKL
jgi:predicted acyltransferase